MVSAEPCGSSSRNYRPRYRRRTLWPRHCSTNASANAAAANHGRRTNVPRDCVIGSFHPPNPNVRDADEGKASQSGQSVTRSCFLRMSAPTFLVVAGTQNGYLAGYAVVLRLNLYH